MRRAVIAMVVAGLVAGTAGAVDLRLPPGKWWENPTLVERVQLTEAQQGTIQKLVYEHAMNMIDLKAAVDRAELELGNQVEQDQLDVAALRAAFGRMQSARQKLETAHFELLLAIRQQLSHAQWRELQALHREVQSERRERLGLPDRPGGAGPMGDRDDRRPRRP